MAQDIVSSMLNAQGIHLVETSSDSDGESADPSTFPSPSPSDEKPKDKTELLKEEVRRFFFISSKFLSAQN